MCYWGDFCWRVFLLCCAMLLFVCSFYNSLPPVSKSFGTLCVLTTLGYQLGVIKAEWLLLDFGLVASKFQVWCFHPKLSSSGFRSSGVFLSGTRLNKMASLFGWWNSIFGVSSDCYYCVVSFGMFLKLVKRL